MSVLRKTAKAFHILRSSGPAGLARAIRRRLRPAPEESLLAFEAFRRLGEASGPRVMVDVGAHVGRALAPFAAAGWRVHAFEPDSANRAGLVQAYGKAGNVSIDPRAVSDQPRQGVVLFKSEESTGISGLSAFRPTHRDGERVDVTSLSAYFRERGGEAPGIDFLKVDTEGHDLFVLKGLPWDRVQPRMILCEFEDAKTRPLGYTVHDMARFLVDKGYRVIVSEWYPITRYGGPHDWRRFATYPCELVDPLDWGNLFAVREDRLAASLASVCKLKR